MIDVNQIHRMDAIEGLKQIPDGSIDLVITDPPYNIADSGKLTVRKGKLISTMEAWGSWDRMNPFDYDILMMQLLSQCYRVLKPGGAMYLFTAREQNAFFIRKAVERGFTYRNVIAMVKRNPLPSFYKNCWRSGFDLCMYLTKGKTKVFNFTSQQDLNSVYPYGSNFKSSNHPTEKPIELIRRYIAISSNPGDLVLDPFMGSGTTAVACKQLGRRYLGFETSADYIEMAKKRIEREGVDHAVTGGKIK